MTKPLFAKWAEGFVDRDGDGKFVKEFQTTFNSSFWEIYLYAALKHLGCTVDFGHHAPDFVVTGPTAFCMEATVASNAKGALPEHTPIRKAPFPRDLNEFNRSAVVRLLNSISEKSKKYLKSYQKLPHVQNKPFVIAVAPFDQPFFYLQTHRAIDATLFGYYVDEQEFLENPNLDRPMPVYKIGGVYKNPESRLSPGERCTARSARGSGLSPPGPQGEQRG